jgi:hypothetical protein
MRLAILRDHALQAELLGPLIRDRHANQTASVRRHEIDRLWRDFLGRDDQIAFVLAIGIVRHDHDLSLGDVAYHIVNRIEIECLLRLRDHLQAIRYVWRACEQLFQQCHVERGETSPAICLHLVSTAKYFEILLPRLRDQNDNRCRSCNTHRAA